MNIQKKIKNWEMFSDDERQKIEDDFDAFLDSESYKKMSQVLASVNNNPSSGNISSKQMKNIGLIIKLDPKKNLSNEVPLDFKKKIFSRELKLAFNKAKRALRGIYISKNHVETVRSCMEEINNQKNSDHVCVAEDSLTAWVNKGTEILALRAGDIRAMKKGQVIKLILFDRNLGDYMHGFTVGKTYNPIKRGCNYAIYTHNKGLRGKIKYKDSGVINEDFEWEINGTPFGSSFWRPISISTKAKIIKLTEDDIPDDTAVGWRGPCIRESDAIKYMPNKVKHYGTWFDDYVPFRYSNLTKMK